jgi:hypothetical protein
MWQNSKYIFLKKVDLNYLKVDFRPITKIVLPLQLTLQKPKYAFSKKTNKNYKYLITSDLNL